MTYYVWRFLNKWEVVGQYMNKAQAEAVRDDFRSRGYLTRITTE